ncbi:hypothetical protein BESB_051670 [Besnoitia besnoiti]|uniref:Type I fatty acid synthase n=1 Tax=Besnoitia besnoiti TaxID=94643 RepID=A0A2A9MHU1_BESBE|nr:hypothetical protein BESB_051670 [Besnoitia besnoiti]PFH35516.1 hypothetical protein BESB_051670 [Besnoitia besnoiti]
MTTIPQVVLSCLENVIVSERGETTYHCGNAEYLFSIAHSDTITFGAFLNRLSATLQVPIGLLSAAPNESFGAFVVHVEGLITERTNGERTPLRQTPTQAESSPSQDVRADVAIVGVACRLPGHANTPGDFWAVLAEGKDAIVPIPSERWSREDFIDGHSERGTMYVEEGGFISGIEEFDNGFFRISSSEARRMDPQQRMLLELSHEALQFVDRDSYKNNPHRIGVFVGCSSSEWTILKTKQMERLCAFQTANTPQALLANRLSYAFNACGPSLTVDSASSSALVAVSVAASHIETGQCDACLVGSSSLMLVPEPTLALCAAGMLAIDSRCRPFDAAANGYGRGEGAVVFLLERWDYQPHGRPRQKSLATIRGHRTNHNGHIVSVTAPSDVAQRKLLQGVLEEAKVEPGQIAYLEAHGTGTKLGDTIEFRAIKSVFASSRTAENPLLVGSGKSNVGHLEGCAGAVGLLKALLVLYFRVVPPTLHFKQINPLIDDEDFCYQITTTKVPLDGDQSILAAVSSFGLGGCNAHMIIESSPKDRAIDAHALSRRHAWEHVRFPVFESNENNNAFGGLGLRHSAEPASGIRQCRRRCSASSFFDQQHLTPVSTRLRRFTAFSSDCGTPLHGVQQLGTKDDYSLETDLHEGRKPAQAVSLDEGNAHEEAPSFHHMPPSQDENEERVTSDTPNQETERDMLSCDRDDDVDEDLVRSMVLETARQVLKESKPIQSNISLKALGLDSLASVEFRDALQESLGITLPASLAFDFPTVDEVCSFLVRKINSEGINEPPLTTAIVAIDGYCAGHTPSVAVKGMACRFPGAENGQTNHFWKTLLSYADCIDEIPASRFDISPIFDADFDARGMIYVREAGILRSAEMFDNTFFEISDTEVWHLDPRQRILLEVAYDALMDSRILGVTGIPSLRTKAVGVVVGCSGNDWNTLLQHQMLPSSSYSGPGTSPALLSNRVSYTLGLQGPSITIDTACSSSLVAMDIARQLLISSQCGIAIVGGVQLLLTAETFIHYCSARMLSPDCRCKTFDAGANGYVRAEGCGVVVLEKTGEKRTLNGHTYGWLSGTANNHVGRSASLTAPNGPAQQAVILASLRSTQISTPASIHMVETHGTGTALGDPIEVGALQAVYGQGTSADAPLVLGALKSRIGHTEGAAGIAGFIKLICSLRYRVAPPNLHLKQFNPHIDISTTDAARPFLFPTKPYRLDTLMGGQKGTSLFGAVSSFGFGGSNAHAIVEVPTLEDVLSDEAQHSGLGGAENAHEPQPMVWLFTGQGSQYVDMAKSLYETEEVFRRTVTECSAYLAAENLMPEGGPSSLEEVIYPKAGSSVAAEELLTLTQYSQVAIFVVELAITRVLTERGLRPAVVLGHSLGEYAAAVAAGVFAWRDALRIVSARARIMSQQPPQDGVMAACRLSAAQVQAALTSELKALRSVAVAADNGPQSIVVSGSRSEVEEVLSFFSVSGKARFLKVSHAFHSPLMAGAVEAVRELFDGVELSRPSIPFSSTVLGRVVVDDELGDSSYWAEQIVRPVMLYEAVRSIDRLQNGARLHFVEVGPRPVLLSLARSCFELARAAEQCWSYCVNDSSSREGTNRLFQAITSGSQENAPATRHVWNHKYFPWTTGHPLLGKQRRGDTETHGTRFFYTSVPLGLAEVFHEYAGGSVPTLPAAAILDAMVVAARLVTLGDSQNDGSSGCPIQLKNFRAHRDMILPPRAARDTQRALTLCFRIKSDLGRQKISCFGNYGNCFVYGDGQEDWLPIADAEITRVPFVRNESSIPFNDLQHRFLHSQDVDRTVSMRREHHGTKQDSPSRGMTIRAVYGRGDEVLAHLSRPRIAAEDGFILSPAILGELFRITEALVKAQAPFQQDNVFSVSGAETVTSLLISRQMCDSIWGHVRILPLAPGDVQRRVADVTMYNEAGQPTMQLLAVRLRATGHAEFRREIDRQQNFIRSSGQQRRNLEQRHCQRDWIPSRKTFSPTQLVGLIRQACQRVIGANREMDVHTSFQQLGVDSLGAIALRDALEDALHLKLPATTFFDYPNMHALSDFIATQVGGIAEETGISSVCSPLRFERPDGAVAVVGVACRLPGSSNNPADFWEMLMSSADCISEVPPTRFDVEQFFDIDQRGKGKMYVREGGFIDRVTLFDNHFFGISAAEAQEMDPRQRICMEVATETLRDARMDHTIVGSNTLVAVGKTNTDSVRVSYRHLSPFSCSGANNSILSNRISYFFGTKGPSMTIDAACASSLIAIVAGFNELRRGGCTTALAIGVNLLLSPECYIEICKATMLSPDCRCKTFDASANGYVRSEGCCGILLKAIEPATAVEASGVYAWLRGATTNHVGRSASLTAPSGPAQQALMRDAIRTSRLQNTENIFAIETHGTGTALGDPIEVGALQAVYGQGTSADAPLVLGALKSRIGHTEGAAGIAGFIKLICSLRYRVAPPNLHLKQFNPHIDISTTDAARPFLFPTKPYRLDTLMGGQKGTSLFGAVSSFGFGGSNAHAIVEVPTLEDVLSDEAQHSGLGGAENAHEPQPMVWLFTGQGSQYVDMAKSLYETEEVFRRTVTECSAYLAAENLMPEGGPSSLEEVIYPKAGSSVAAEELLTLTQYSQVAIFVVELAITRVLTERGLRPAVVLGHSLGEYAAAVAAGVFAWRDALRIVSARARIMSQQPPQDGVMAACRLSAAQVQAALTSELKALRSVAVAADNGPQSIVVSGSRSEVEEVLSFFSVSGKARFLKVSHAFHSPLMAGAVEAVRELFDGVELSRPSIPFSSTVLGRVVVDDELGDSSYWAEQITQPVRFREAVEAAVALELGRSRAFVEVGPNRVLAVLGRNCVSETRATDGDWLSIVDSKSDSSPADVIALLQERFGQLQTHVAKARHMWNHSAFPWTVPRHPLIGGEASAHSERQGATTYRSRVRYDVLNALCDHVILGAPLMPGAAFIDAILAAGRLAATKSGTRLTSPSIVTLTDVSIFSPLLLRDSVSRAAPLSKEGFQLSSLELSVEMSSSGGGHLVEVRSRQADDVPAAANDDSTQAHCRGQLAVSSGGIRPSEQAGSTLADVRRRFSSQVACDVEALYQTFADLGWQYGVLFRVITQLYRTDTEALAELRLPRPLLPSEEGFVVHPAILDGLFQAAGSLLLADDKTPAGSVYVPVGIDNVVLAPKALRRDVVWGRVAVAEKDREARQRHERVLDCTLYDGNGEAVLYLNGLRSRLLRTEVLLSAQTNGISSNRLWSLEWTAIEAPAHLPPISGGKAETAWLVAGVQPPLKSMVEELLCRALPAAKIIFCKSLSQMSTMEARNTLQQETWDTIIHLGGTTSSTSEMECLNDVLALVQGLTDWVGSDSGPAKLPSIFLVTRGADSHVAASPSVPVARPPVHTGVRGLFRTAKVELEALWNRFVPFHYIDVEPVSEAPDITPDELRRLIPVVQQLGTESQAIESKLGEGLSGASLYESETILRGSERLLPRLVPFRPVESGDNNALAEALLGTIVITGGLGGIGLVVAKWLADRGAKAIVLVSRTGSPSADVQQSEEWQSFQARQGAARIATARCDVGDLEQVKLLFRSLRDGEFVCLRTGQTQDLPPVRGVMHAAGVLKDCPIHKQDRETLASVFQPKAQGGWNIHFALEELGMSEDIAVFLGFSSIASLVGNPGQANYAAANSSLDALISYRRGRGLPGHSIQWGPWTEQGMAAGLRDRLERAGFVGISNEVGVETVGAIVSQGKAGNPVIACQQFNWARFALRYRGCLPAMFKEQTQSVTVRGREERVSKQLSGPGAAAEGVFTSMSDEELKTFIQTTVAGAARQVLGRGEDPPPDVPLQDLGIDSLGAVEFRNTLQDLLGLKLSATILFDHPTLRALTTFLSSRLESERSPESSSSSLANAVPAPLAGHQRADIAVVGMACRLPGSVSDPESFWKMLLTLRDCIQEIPPSRFSIDDVYDPDPDAKGKIYVREGGFIDGAELFDNRYFGISDAEAREMDPRQRVSLEVSYEAFIDAGYSREELYGSPVGVFVGAMNHDKLYDDLRQLGSYSGTSNALAILSNRLSYTFGLTGPSIVIDTACSSSLVALDLARLDLCYGSSGFRLVLGVNLMPTVDPYIQCCKARMLSSECRCKTFDADANGYVRSEGCAAVLLQQRTSRASSKHAPYALLRGTANNHVGRSASITAPNGPAQQAVIRAALDSGRHIPPWSMALLETHGTGTALGDPIEVGALQAVYGQGTSADAPLVLGALKSRIGHTEGAAGIAGFIKLICSLRHRVAPPNLHLKQFNPHIDISTTAAARPFLFPTKPYRLDTLMGGQKGTSLFGAVSSFGFGGSNAHAIVEVPTLEDVLSDEAQHSGLGGAENAHEPQPMVWLFTGQGSQYVDMAKSLYETEEVFRRTVTECSAYLAAENLMPEGGPSSLEEVIYPKAGSSVAAEELLTLTQYSQVAIFVVELAITRVLTERGLRPAVVLGHSLGEYAAAVAAGVFAWRDALRIVSARARIMSQQPPQDGVMAACRLSAAQVQAALTSELKALRSVAVAADNGPQSIVVSGSRSEVEEVLSFFSVSGKARFLKVSHAFHSPLMAGAVEAVRELFDGVELSRPSIPFSSTVLGRVVVDDELGDSSYWAEQVTQPVRFREATLAAFSLLPSCLIGIEVGPKPTLARLVPSCLGADKSATCTWVCVCDESVTSGSGYPVKDFEHRLEALRVCKVQWNHRSFPLSRMTNGRTQHLDARSNTNAQVLQQRRSHLWREEWVYHSGIVEYHKASAVAKEAWIIAGVPPQHVTGMLQYLKMMKMDTSRVVGMGAISTLESLRALVQGGKWAGILSVSGIWTTTPAVDCLMETTDILRHYGKLSQELDLPPLAVVTRGAQCAIISEEESRRGNRNACDRETQTICADHHTYRDAPVHSGMMAFCRTARLELERCCNKFRSLLYFDLDWNRSRETEDRHGLHLDSVLGWLMRTGTPSPHTEINPTSAVSPYEGDIIIRGQSYFVPRAAAVLLKSPSVAGAGMIDSTKSYIVTGGLGGIGVAVACWLVRRGAGKVYVWSRSGSVKEDVKQSDYWSELNAAVEGGKIETVRCDVSVVDQVRVSFSTAITGSPLGGIFHCAGTEGKDKLQDLSKQDIVAVYGSKVEGAWNLHRVCQEMSVGRHLDFFVLFSSIAALPGNDAFAVYAAANCCLDNLAEYRRSLSLPAQSIQWGPWLDVGMAARTASLERFMRTRGIQGFHSEEAISVLEDLLAARGILVSTAAVQIDWRLYAHIFGSRVPAWLLGVVPDLVEPLQGTSAAVTAAPSVSSLGLQKVEAAVIEVARRMSGASDAVTATTEISSLGLDSLGAVEFRNALQETLNVKLPASLLVEYPSLNNIIEFILESATGDGNLVDDANFVIPKPSMVDDGFAVVGMGCRIPNNAVTPEAFWDMLLNEVDAVHEIPMDRFNMDAFYDPDPEQDKCYTRDAALLDSPDVFDNAFFNLSEKEVLAIDPQQCMLLEVAYEAFFEAGFTKSALMGKDFGVFCAAYNNDFQFTNLTQGKATMCVLDEGEGRRRIPSLGEAAGYPEPGGFMCFIPNRISYSFGLTGPSIGIDAACASALVAFDAAVTKLKRRACSGALIGGVNIILSPTFFLGGCRAHQFSRAGRCKTFDCHADGLVRGEGCGAVCVLPLAAARDSGSFIHAVVRGSASCHYGRSSLITSPNTRALTRVLRLALEDAGAEASSVRYYEAHGTATVLGDVIEMSAVRDVFQTNRTAAAPLHLGTVHNNIGHLDAAAGIVAFIKTVLCLQHRFVPANIHFTSLHPDIQGIDPHLIKYTRESQEIITEPHSDDAPRTLLGANLAYGMGGSVAAVITEAGDDVTARQPGSAPRRPKWNHRRFPLNTQKFIFLMGAMGQLSMDDMPTPQSDVVNVMNRLSDTILNVTFMRQLRSPRCGAARMRSVFVTGATGFIGSQLLFHLLQARCGDLELGEERGKLQIYCLVRARDRAHALYRIKDAFVGRGIEWDPDYNRRVIPVVGDLEENENMGLGVRQLDFLTRVIDAVYHAADNVNFAAPYDELRKTNVTSLIGILKLCTTFVAKPLHLISNFSHHLQYFAAFSNDLNIPVEETISPPLKPDMVKRLEQQMPAGIVGYPWTKWAVEEIVGRMKDVLQHRCKEDSVDKPDTDAILSKFQVVVYRLPNSCVYYRNGYTNFGNASLALVLACAQERMLPPGVPPVGAPFLTTPVDLTTEIVVKLSMTKERQHDVYHLVSLRAARRDNILQVAKWLFSDISECTVDELLRRVDANKENSPAHNLRAAMRFWRSYWYCPDTDRENAFPIMTGHIEDDIPGITTAFPHLADTWIRMAAYCVKNYHMVRHPFTLAIPFDILKKAIQEMERRWGHLPSLPRHTEFLLKEASSTEDCSDIAAAKALAEHSGSTAPDCCVSSEVPDPRARA